MPTRRHLWASQVALVAKNLPAMQDTWIRSLGWEDPLEEGMATCSSILAWRIPWTEEPGGLQSTGSQRARHNWNNLANTHAHILTSQMERGGACVLGKTTVSCLWTPLDLIPLLDDLDESKFPACSSESWNPDSTVCPSMIVCHEGCWELTWENFSTISKTILWPGCPSPSQRWVFGDCLFFLGSF